MKLSGLLIASFVMMAAIQVEGGADSEIKESFDALIFPAVEKTVLEPGDKQGGGIAWGAAYQLAALAEMLDATRDTKYAELFIRLGDWILAARDDQHNLKDEIRGSVFPAWSSTSYSKGKRYTWAVHTGMIVAPMAQFAAVVRRDKALAARWSKDADRFLEAAIRAAAVHDGEYRKGPGPDEGYVYCPYLEKNLPLNMQNALARAWLAIDDATGKPDHRERVLRLAHFFKNRTRAMDDGAAVWGYWPPLEGTNETFEDTSHAAINVDFMVRCFEHQILFSREDLAALEASLTRRVLISNDRISDTVGGGAAVNKYRIDVLRWARLGRHSPAVRERLMELSRLPEFVRNTTSLPLALALLRLPPTEQ